MPSGETGSPLHRSAGRHALAGVAALLLAIPAPAAERPSGEVSAVRLLRFVGHPGGPGKRTAAAALTLDVRGRTIRFQVERVEVLKGDVLGAEVLAELSPYNPSLRLRGAPPILAKLEASTAHDEVQITGWHRAGSRDLLVSDIQVSPGSADKER